MWSINAFNIYERENLITFHHTFYEILYYTKYYTKKVW